MTNAQNRARNLGSNYTTFRYAGKSIAYLEMLQDSGQPPVAQPQVIHPLGSNRPTEIVTPRAIDAGTLQVTIRELWNQEIWQQLAGLANSNNIIQVFEAVARTRNPISCAKIITPPNGPRYGKTYHNCVVANIQDGESFDIRTLSAPKTLSIYYTHTTRL